MKVTTRPRARSDIIEQADFLEHVADLDVAERFLDAVEASLERLASMPLLGSPLHFANPVLAGLRRWPVESFEKHLIFYRPLPDGIEVIRVLHGSRDIPRILGEQI